ncbi:amino acid ABC transporter permease, partial [Pseudomonas sp. HMWF031]
MQSCFSVVLLALIAWALWSTGFWLVQRADWSVVSGNLPLFAIGSYPEASRWRPILWLGSL